MIENRVSYEVAKLAKEKGFNELCSHYYVLDFQNFERSELIKFSVPFDNDNVYQEVRLSKGQPHLALAPTQSLLQKWLRDNYKIHLTVTSISQKSWQCHIQSPGDILGDKYIEDAYTYEEALEDGLKEALETLNDN